ncbi:MAG: tetraacyldisaccharide 4'-kinase [Bacteroidota bacterium]
MFKFLLFPFAIIYQLITSFRNHLYNIGYKKSIAFDIPVISVGNLTVGGTGKTPHVNYITSIIQGQLNVKSAILSRGYGRKSRGFLLADSHTNSLQLGDEPLQLYYNFKGEVPVAVCEERIFGIPALIAEHPDLKAIVLDDAFQHRKVKPGLNILLSDFHRPFYHDYLLPVGRLRESRKGAVRADAVIVTKIPENISSDQLEEMLKNVATYTKAIVFFSAFSYSAPVHFNGKKAESFENIILVTGIAQTVYLLEYVTKIFNVVNHIKLEDHVVYNEHKISSILSAYKQYKHKKPVILTTEKDMVKLKEILPEDNEIPFYFLPIKVRFLKDEDRFIQLITKYLESV